MINIADVIETIQGVVQQITIVVRFLAAFSILAGAVILASSIASTQFRRVREVVVLKTLGAKRNHIAAVFSVEFIVLGLLAGLVGVIFANLLSRVLLHRLDVVFHMEWLATVVALLGTAVLAISDRLGGQLSHPGPEAVTGAQGRVGAGRVALTRVGPGSYYRKAGRICRLLICRIAPSFNGRTAASGAAYRGSNPWGATTSAKLLLINKIKA